MGGLVIPILVQNLIPQIGLVSRLQIIPEFTGVRPSIGFSGRPVYWLCYFYSRPAS